MKIFTGNKKSIFSEKSINPLEDVTIINTHTPKSSLKMMKQNL